MKYFWRVLPYLKPYWLLATVAIFLIALSGTLGLIVPLPLKIIVDYVLDQKEVPQSLKWLIDPFHSSRVSLLIFAAAAGVLIVFVDQLLNVVSGYVTTKIEQYMVLDFRSDLFQHAQRLSLAFHDQKRSGMLIYAINYQGHAAASLVMTIPPICESAYKLVAMFVVMYFFNPTLALLSLTVVPFLYYSVGYYATHIQSRLEKVNVMEGDSLSIIHEAISMLRVIVAFGREPHEYQRFRKQGANTVRSRVTVTVRQMMFNLAVQMITAVGTAIILGYGAYLVIQAKLTTGDMLMFVAYLGMVYKPLEMISYTIGSLQDKFVALRMAYDIMDRDPEIKDAPNAKPIERSSGAITFEHVEFHYKDRVDTLIDINFEAKPGQLIGIAGPTGAGKSTLVSLIPRFYAPQGGRILIDGQDITSLTLKSLRAQVAVVLQEPLLFSGSIADNIRYGKLEATEEEIIAAATAANAHDFISRLPDGYQTTLGERGAQISVGERQRISIARAFLKESSILILDEPTSAVDSKTEAVILEALERLMSGKTTFMIAHRLSTIRRADKILVIDRGRLIEQGTHDELIQIGGLYKQLSDLQSGTARRRLEPIEPSIA